LVDEIFEIMSQMELLSFNQPRCYNNRLLLWSVEMIQILSCEAQKLRNFIFAYLGNHRGDLVKNKNLFSSPYYAVVSIELAVPISAS